jgi:DNA-binding transcriptional regulator/RsmH inhibitor MraZ
MPMVFNGHYQRAIDADQRIELPAAIREVNDSDRYAITRGLEGGVFLYPAIGGVNSKKRWPSSIRPMMTSVTSTG